ncbi:MAG: T9SS type A sorting domain-containing protein [Flavobacteriales bacterium]|nr:T9SS type A sorting domain-containing protein [Flavobacteriales bacterium]
MRSLVTFLFAFALVAAIAQDQTYNVLFVGNSYIYTNDLPTVFEQVAAGKSNSAITAGSTLASYTFELHTQNGDTQDLLHNGSWDYVILQEQSQMPAFPDNQVQADVFPYAKQLVDTARFYNECSMPVFLMTWGRIDGDQDNCAAWPPVCTYDGMQDLLTERYQEMAFMNNCWTAPVGEAWRQVRDETNDEILLYSNDGSHPSAAGTYLMACVLYTMLYDDSPVGCTYTGGLDAETAQYLQTVAGSVVQGDEEAWNYYPVVYGELDFVYQPPFHSVTTHLSYWADSMTVTINGNEYVFEDGDVNALQFADGTYTYEMVVHSECGDETFVDELVVGNGSAVNDETRDSFNVFPNPTSEQVYTSGVALGAPFVLYNNVGIVVNEGNYGREGISVRDVAPGTYFLALQVEGAWITRPIIVKR